MLSFLQVKLSRFLKLNEFPDFFFNCNSYDLYLILHVGLGQVTDDTEPIQDPI